MSHCPHNSLMRCESCARDHDAKIIAELREDVSVARQSLYEVVDQRNKLISERDRLAALVVLAEKYLNAEDAFAFIEEQCEMGEANGLDVARGAARCSETREAFRAALAAGKGQET